MVTVYTMMLSAYSLKSLESGISSTARQIAQLASAIDSVKGQLKGTREVETSWLPNFPLWESFFLSRGTLENIIHNKIKLLRVHGPVA